MPALRPTIESRVRRTLTPSITSRLASIVCSAWGTSTHLMSSNSPTSPVSIPWTEMLSWAKMRVSLTSMMYLRNPGKVWAPAEPASTTVVEPRPRHSASGLTPRYDTPSNTWTWRSIRPGATIRPAASTTWAAWSAGIASARAATRPSLKATSRRSWIF